MKEIIVDIFFLNLDRAGLQHQEPLACDLCFVNQLKSHSGPSNNLWR